MKEKKLPQMPERIEVTPEMHEKAKKARNAYMEQYRARRKEAERCYQIAYWAKKYDEEGLGRTETQ